MQLMTFTTRINYGHTPAAWDDRICHLGMTFARLVRGRIDHTEIADSNVMRNALEISRYYRA